MIGSCEERCRVVPAVRRVDVGVVEHPRRVVAHPEHVAAGVPVGLRGRVGELRGAELRAELRGSRCVRALRLPRRRGWSPAAPRPGAGGTAGGRRRPSARRTRRRTRPPTSAFRRGAGWRAPARGSACSSRRRARAQARRRSGCASPARTSRAYEVVLGHRALLDDRAQLPLRLAAATRPRSTPSPLPKPSC